MAGRPSRIRRAALGALRAALAAAALCSAALFVLWRLEPMIAADEPPASAIPGGVWVVHHGPMEVSYVFQGTVKAKKSEKMRPQFKRWAKISHLVEEGVRVSKGDVLARFDGTEFSRSLTEVERGIARVSEEVRKSETDLGILKASGPAEIEKARIALRTAEMELERLKLGELPDTERKRRVQVDAAQVERDIAKRKYAFIPGLIGDGYLVPERLREDGLALKKREMQLEDASCSLDMFLKYESQTLLLQKTARAKAAESDYRTVEKRIENQVRNLEAQLLASKAQLAELRKQEAELKEELGKVTMTAETAGIVVYGDDERPWRGNNIAVGERVGRWHVLFSLPDMTALVVKMKVSEADISNLKVGMPVKIRVPSAGFDGLNGKISKIPEITARDDWRSDPNVKEFEVEVDVEGALQGVRPGISASVSVRSASLDGVIGMPLHALRGDKLNLFVYVLEPGAEKPLLRKTPVQVGLRSRRFAEIKSGLSDGDLVFLGDPPAELLRAEEEALSGEGPAKAAGEAAGASEGGEGSFGAASGED